MHLNLSRGHESGYLQATLENEESVRMSMDIPNLPRSDESWVDIMSQSTGSSSEALSQAREEIEHFEQSAHGEEQYHARRRLARNAESGPAGIVYSHIDNVDSTTSEASEDHESELASSLNEHGDSSARDTSSAIHSSVSSAALSMHEQQLTQNDNNGGHEETGHSDEAQVFTPLANVFTHPPQPLTATQSPSASTNPSTAGPVYCRHHTSPILNRTTYRRPTPSRIRSSANHVDHDAALRASLTTLLSCAAAARGLPKREVPDYSTTARRTGLGSSAHYPAQGPASRVQPATLRLVPESEVLGDAVAAVSQMPAETLHRDEPAGPSALGNARLASGPRRGRAIAGNTYTTDQSTSDNRSSSSSSSRNNSPQRRARRSTRSSTKKRKSSSSPSPAAPAPKLVERQHQDAQAVAPTASPTVKRRSRKQRLAATPSNAQPTPRAPVPSTQDLFASSYLPAPLHNVSPTLASWALSAGFLVLFGAISFSAGYILGHRDATLGQDDFFPATAEGQLLRSGSGPSPGVTNAEFTSTRDAGGSGRDIYRGLRRLKWSCVGPASSSSGGGSFNGGSSGGIMSSSLIGSSIGIPA